MSQRPFGQNPFLGDDWNQVLDDEDDDGEDYRFFNDDDNVGDQRIIFTRSFVC